MKIPRPLPEHPLNAIDTNRSGERDYDYNLYYESISAKPKTPTDSPLRLKLPSLEKKIDTETKSLLSRMSKEVAINQNLENAAGQILTDTVVEMIAEIQAINETNLQSIEEYTSISSRFDLLDKENQFTVFG